MHTHHKPYKIFHFVNVKSKLLTVVGGHTGYLDPGTVAGRGPTWAAPLSPTPLTLQCPSLSEWCSGHNDPSDPTVAKLRASVLAGFHPLLTPVTQATAQGLALQKVPS